MNFSVLSMNHLDIAVGVVLLFFLLRGLFRGFVKEVVGVLGLFAAFFIAARYYPEAAELFGRFLQNPAYRNTVGFLVLLLALFFLFGLFGLILDKLVKIALPRSVNSILGGLVALCKGLILAALVLMTTTAFISPDSQLFTGSRSWPYLRFLAESLKQWIPSDLKQSVEYKLERLPADLKPITPGLTGDEDQQVPAWKALDLGTSDAEIEPPAGGDAPPAWPGSTEGSQ